MSWGGFEYNGNQRQQFGGFDADPMIGGFDNGFGGGFMNEEKKSSEKKNRDRQSLMPVSIKQLQNLAEVDGALRVDDVELNLIRIIGTISDRRESATRLDFKINDGSGVIDGTLWIDKETLNGDHKAKFIQDGTLVRGIGQLRDYEGRRSLMAYDIAPVEDWNELTHHILDIIYTHLQNTKGPIPGTTGPTVAGMMSGAPRAMTSSFNQPISLQTNEKDSALMEMVYSAYSSSTSEEGLMYKDVADILKSRGQSISLDQLTGLVTKLLEEGRLYTTIDDDHHRPTEY